MPLSYNILRKRKHTLVCCFIKTSNTHDLLRWCITITHVGVYGNEQADAIARPGLKLDSTTTNTPLSIKEVNNICDRMIHHEWERKLVETENFKVSSGF